jgi:hypothetical protein
LISNLRLYLLKLLVRVSALFFLIAFLLLFFISIGINLSNIKFNNIQIDNINLYLNDTNKLVLVAKDINIIQETKDKDFDIKSSLNHIKSLIDKYIYVLKYFDFIDLHFNIDKKIFSIEYYNNHFYLSFDKLIIDTNINFNENSIELFVNDLKFKDIKTLGKLTIDLKDNNFKYSGNLFLNEKKANIGIFSDYKNIGILLSDVSLDSIKFLNEYLTISEYVDSWIFNRPNSKIYNLNTFSMILDFKTFVLDADSLFLDLNLKDSEVKFEDELDGIKSEEITLILKNSNIHIKSKNGKYKDKKLENIDVVVGDIFNNLFVDVNFDVNTSFDDTIKSLIGFYDIQIPINQKKGTCRANINLHITEDVSFSSDINLSNSIISLYNQDLKVKDLNLNILDNIVNINASNVKYKKLLDSKFNAKLDVLNKNILGILDINSLFIKDLINIKDYKTPIFIDFKDNVFIELDNLMANISFKDDSLFIDLNDLTKLKKYSKLLNDLKIDYGRLNLVTEDFNKFLIDIYMNNNLIPISKYYKPLNEFNFIGAINLEKDILNLSDSVNFIDISKKQDDTKLFLNHVDLVFDSNSTSSNMDTKIEIIAQNSNIIYKDKTFNSLKHSIKKDGKNLDVKTVGKDNSFFIKDKNSVLNINGKFEYTFLNNFLNIDNFNKGKFDLALSGDKTKALRGKIVVNEANVKTSSFVEFLNTLSSMLSSVFDFSIASLSQKGFDIKSGFIDFEYLKKEDIVKVTNFRFNGVGLTLLGNGTIDLKTKKIQFDIDVLFLKGIGNIIGNIPIVGNLLFGENRNFAIETTVNGTYENPVYNTHTLESILKAPLNILQRVITSPIKIFE